MGLRIFSVNRDGSYSEVPPVKESLLHKGDAFIIVDRKEKRIYTYRKMGISSALAYSAGRAATNLNTRKGSKYKVINIEQEDKERMLTFILDKLEEEDIKEKSTKVNTVETRTKPKGSYVFGEKVRERAIIQQESKVDEHSSSTYQPVAGVEEKSSSLKSGSKEFQKSYDLQGLVKALAGKMIFEIGIENAKNMNKPPKDQLRRELIKQVDILLDSIY